MFYDRLAQQLHALAEQAQRADVGVGERKFARDAQQDRFDVRFERDGKCLVYSTDSEHRLEDEQERAGFIRFFDRADLVVFDAMYSLADAISVKADWGHSSNIVAVELCQAAQVRRLAMFHHEPAYSDAQIARVLQETRRFEQITRDGHALDVLSAWDGLELSL